MRRGSFFEALWDDGFDRSSGGAEASRQEWSRQASLSELQERVEKLTLINMALWSFVRDHLSISEEDLCNRVQEIDISDGQLDGKVRFRVAACPECGRQMAQRHQRCLYCGHAMPRDSEFAAFRMSPDPSDPEGSMTPEPDNARRTIDDTSEEGWGS